MASHYYSEFKERKVTAQAPDAPRKGVAGAERGGRGVAESPGPYTCPGPCGGPDLNRQAKFAKLKAYVKKQGVS